MRNLQECQAEVFRRSEKRMQERRQHRNRIWMACVPLALCLALLLTFTLPELMPERSQKFGETNAALGELTGHPYESPDASVTRIEISGPDFFRACTEAAEVLAISEHLHLYAQPSPESNTDTGGLDEIVQESTDANQNYGNKNSGSASTAYTVTLKTREGVATEYCLTENTLENLTTGQTYVLSQKQVNELEKILGIPQG